MALARWWMSLPVCREAKTSSLLLAAAGANPAEMGSAGRFAPGDALKGSTAGIRAGEYSAAAAPEGAIGDHFDLDGTVANH